jgi:hypothetical protein
MAVRLQVSWEVKTLQFDDGAKRLDIAIDLPVARTTVPLKMNEIVRHIDESIDSAKPIGMS